MKDPDKAIICGACKVPILGPSDPKPDAQMICPRCGARDSYEQVRKVIMDHAKYRLHCAAQSGLADLHRKLGRPSPRAAADDGEQPFFKWRIKD